LKVNSEKELKTALQGSLLGLMAGDALGLPFEGMRPGRIEKILQGPMRHYFLVGKGMVSDDTEHALITASALIRSWNDPQAYSRNLAWRLRWWFLRLPAGIGLATGRSIIKLWCGFPASHSGVFSAGNGPAMRAPVIGVVFADQPRQLKEYVKLTTVITHTDPKAYLGSLAIAQAAAMAATSHDVTADDYLQTLRELFADEDDPVKTEFMNMLGEVQAAINSGNTIEELIRNLGLEKGVSGYIYHTVPVVLFIWLRFQHDFARAIETVIKLGGDTDTTAAILGGIVGARAGREGIPQPWLENIIEWPLSVRYVEKVSAILARVIHDQQPARLAPLPGPLIFIRNMVFLVIVLLHGFRRLLPPY